MNKGLKILGLIGVFFLFVGASSCDKEINIVGIWNANCTDYAGNPLKPGFTWVWDFKEADETSPQPMYDMVETDPNGFVKAYMGSYMFQQKTMTMQNPFSPGTGDWFFFVSEKADGSIELKDTATICRLTK